MDFIRCSFFIAKNYLFKNQQNLKNDVIFFIRELFRKDYFVMRIKNTNRIVEETEKSCSPFYSFVSTKTGLTKMSNLLPNVPVLTKNKRYKRVNQKNVQQFQPVYSVRLNNFFNIDGTKNKLFFVKTEQSDGSFSEPYFKKLIELNGADYLCMPVEQEEFNDKDNEFYYSLGIFCALCKSVTNKETQKSEKYLVCPKKTKIDFPFEVEDCTEDKAKLAKYKIKDNEIRQALISLCYGTGEKRIPETLISVPKEAINEFLRGYFILNKSEIPEKFFIENEKDAKILFFLISKATESLCGVEGRIQDFNIYKKGNPNAFYSEGCFWIPVEKVEKLKTEVNAYTLGVDTDFSYVADFILGK